jgi:pimeloyl-ACP methyl ester carboxylesterase
LDPYVVADLDRFLMRRRDEYGSIILVGHSQGGLLAKLYVINKLIDNAGTDLRVDRIVTLGTPHLGRVILTPYCVLQRMPLLGRWVPLRQLGELASCSNTIAKIARYWQPSHVSRTPVAATSSVRYIESVAVAGAFDRWVTERSAAGNPAVDTRSYASAGHPSLVKARSRREEVAQLILDQMRAHAYPHDVVRELRVVKSDASAKRKYVRTHADMVWQLVREHRPNYDEDASEIKTAILLEDFALDFESRPLRNLSLGESLALYARRSLRGRR